MQIGLIGLGNMGERFAARFLSAGNDLVVFDTNLAAMSRLERLGAASAVSAADLASRTAVVFLSLPTPQVVEQVATGPSGVLEGSAVKIVVDLSTTGPSTTKAIAQRMSERGVEFLGAPVSGGTVAAEKGTLTVMAAGGRQAFDEVVAALRCIGQNIFYLGEDPGLGQTMKIINNTLCAVSAVASFELLVFGAKSGLEPKTMLDILNVSSGRSFATLEKIPQCILHRDFPMRFTTELLHKDVKLCLDEAEKAGVALWVSPMARQFLSFAISQGDGPKDYARTIEHFERWGKQQFGEASAAADPAKVF